MHKDDGYYTEIYGSVKEIDPEEWQGLMDPHVDLAMDQRLIHLLENKLSDQARFWTVVVRDLRKKLVACACLGLFQTDVAQSSPLFLQKAIQRLRKYYSNAFKLKVLFCGLPLPSGHTHLRISPAVHSPLIMRLLNQVMTEIAQKEKAQLLVVKELDVQELEKIGDLRCLGFIRGELEPIFQFSSVFKNFDAYQAALRSGYRRQVQLNVKKFNQWGFRVEHLTDPVEIYSRFSDEVHALYLNVWTKAKEKLECFPADFFRELPQSMPNQVALTLISHESRPVAFALGVMSDDIYHNLYIGLDYAHLESGDLYFNLFYQELDAVFHLNKKKILLGQTSGTFKSRLGATADPRFFWVRPLNPLLRFLFKYFQNLIFPKVKPPQGNQVFKI